MNEPHDQNRTVDIPADELDAGLAAAFGKPPEGPRSSLDASQRPVLLREAKGESDHIVKPNSDAMPPKSDTGDRYQLFGEIARGGMGAVLRGRDVDLGRDLAVKILLEKRADRPEVARRFLEEAQIGGQLQHPGVVPVYDIGRFGDRPFFTMKLVKGKTLAMLLAERNVVPVSNRHEPLPAGWKPAPQDLPRLLSIALQVAQALAYAHAKGVIHRDRKPANIMVGAFGEVQVMDWGLAKVLAEGGVADEERASREREREEGTVIRTARSSGKAGSFGTDTEAGSLLGTPAYMPPEQANGHVAHLDRRADVFGLGAILCEILTGQPPYVGRSSEEVRRKSANGDLAEALARLDACGADTELIVLTKTCLSPEARDRPKDAQAVADGLTAYLDSVQERLHQAELAEAAAKAKAVEVAKRRRLTLALAATVALVLLTAVVVSSYFAVEANFQAKEASANAKKADAKAQESSDNARKAEEQTGAAIKAEKEAQREKKRAEEQLGRAEWLVYAGKLSLAQSAFAEGDGGLALAYLDDCQWNLRGWEHRHLWTRFNAKQTLLHTVTVTSVAYSPDGKRILTGGGDTARVWDADKGRELLTLKGHTGWVSSVAYSPDGKRIVTGSHDKTAKVWDADKGREVLTLKGHTNVINSVAFSADGNRIVTGSQDKTAKVWDAEKGQEVLALKGHTRGVDSVAFSPDGKRIVTGSWDNSAKVWDADTGQEVLTLKGHTLIGHVSSVAFSPDGKRILTSNNNKAKVWDADTGQEIFTLKGNTADVSSVAFRPDGKRIVTGGGTVDQPGEVKVWDADKGQEILALKGHRATVISVAFSADGKRIVTGSVDKTAKVWDADKGQEILALKGRIIFVFSVAFSADGKRIVTGSLDKTARVWDADTGQEVLTLKGHTYPVYSVAFRPDGKRIVTGGSVADQPGEVKVWDADTGQEVLALKGHTGWVRSVAYSPDGKRIVTGGGTAVNQPGEVKVWDADTGQEVLALKGHTAPVSSVAFSADGKRILTASGDKTAKVWDADKGQEVLTLKGHTNFVTSVAFSADGNRIVTGSVDGTAKVWNANKGQVVLALRGHTDLVESVAFSADGKRIFAWDTQKKVLAWSTVDGTPLDPVNPPAGPPPGPARSADGFLHAMPHGNTIGITDMRQSPNDNSWPLPDAAERKRYHTEQAGRAEQEKQWFAAAFHLRRVLRDDPENAAMKTRLTRAEKELATAREKTPVQKAPDLLASKLSGPVHEVGKGLELRGQLDQQTSTLIYQVKLAAGKTYVIDLVSPDQKALDPYLVLSDASSKKLAEDNDSGGGLNARIVFRAEQTGTYRIHATSFNQGAGAFTLTVRDKAPPPKEDKQ